MRLLLVGVGAERLVRGAMDGMEPVAFELTVVESGAAGLEAILGGAHDLCLVDAPEGGSAASELIRRARGAGSRVPFLLLTGAATGASDSLPRAQLTAFTLERAARYALERADLLAQRDAAVGELARRDTELEELAAIISHDLRSPLQTISGHAEMLELRYGGKLEPGADAMIARMMRGVTRLERMLTDLLRFAKATGPAVVGEPVPLDAALDGALQELQPELQASGGTVGRTQALPVVRGDARLLGQLLSNLVANAIKFRGGAPLRVEVSATRGDGSWQVDVADNVVGVAPKELSGLFTLYRRGSNAVNLPGSGVGLTICQKIVQRHGGRIWAENIPTGGFRVSFTLPDAGPSAAGEPPG